LVLFLSIFLSISLYRSHLQLRSIDLKRASLYAFYAAEAGIDDAIFELRSNLNWPLTPPDEDGNRVGFTNKPLIWQEGTPQQENIGSYSVTVKPGLLFNNIPTVKLESTGQNTGNPGEPIVTRRIQARVAIQNPANFFTSTVGSLVFASGAVVGTPAFPANILARDITFNVNTGLPVGDPRRSITVNGDVEYIRNLSGYPDPDVTVSGDVTQRPPITFVGVDLNRYRNLAQASGRYIPSDFVISGDIDWGSLATGNGLVFVEGNVHIQGTVKQSIHIVAAGNIYIDGNIEYDPMAPIRPQIGLSASGDVIIPAGSPNNMNVDALIIADGGTFQAEYAGVPKGTLNFEGVIAVRGSGIDTAISLNVFSNRNLVYDAALNNSPTVPFMGSLVNIIQWQDMDIPPPLIEYR